MKRVIQVCIILVVFMMATTSAAYMKNINQTESIQSIAMEKAQVFTYNLIDLSGHGDLDSHNRPVEPAILFLFGIGIIGIYSIHRLKFK